MLLAASCGEVNFI